MTDKTLEKANQLKSEIESLDDVIDGIKLKKVRERYESNTGKPFRVRFVNAWYPFLNKTEAKILLFSDGDGIGTNIPVDEEFVDYVSDYFKKKREKLIKELRDLS